MAILELKKSTNANSKAIEAHSKAIEAHSKAIVDLKRSVKEDIKILQLSLKESFEQVKTGMGKSFERYNAAWLRHHFAVEYPNMKLEVSQHIKLSSGLEIEIDIISKEPLLLAEATSILQSPKKITKFFNKIDQLRADGHFKDKEPKLFFFVNMVVEKYREETKKMLDSRGCILIVQDPDE